MDFDRGHTTGIFFRSLSLRSYPPARFHTMAEDGNYKKRKRETAGEQNPSKYSKKVKGPRGPATERRHINFTLVTDARNNLVRIFKDAAPRFTTTNPVVQTFCARHGVECQMEQQTSREKEEEENRVHTSLTYWAPQVTEESGKREWNVPFHVPVNVSPSVDAGVVEKRMAALLFPKKPAVKPFRHQVAVIEAVKGVCWIRGAAGRKQRTTNKKGRYMHDEEGTRGDADAELLTADQVLEDVDEDRERSRRHVGKRRVLLRWAMGSGKTLGSLMMLFQNGGTSPRHLLIVCTNTTLPAWRSAVETIIPLNGGGCTEVIIVGETHYKRQAFAAVGPIYEQKRQKGPDGKYVTKYAQVGGGIDVLLLDEGQDFRNMKKDMIAGIQAAAAADNLIVCSGTPLQNTGRDAYSLLAMFGADVEVVSESGRVAGRAKAAAVEEEDGEEGEGEGGGKPEPYTILFNGEPASEEGPSVAAITARLKGVLVSDYDPATHAKLDYAAHYPKIVRRRLHVPMTYPHALYYLAMRGRLTLNSPDGKRHVHYMPTGNHYSRQQVMAANGADVVSGRSPKAVAIVKDMARRLTKEDGEKEKEDYRRVPHDVVYSEFLEEGIHHVRREIEHYRLPWRVAEVTGSVPEDERDRLINAFSAGELDVLLISRAAALGTNIMGAERMYCMEAFPNVFAQSQTEMRVVRVGSHPPGATVQLISVVATFPSHSTLHTSKHAEALEGIVHEELTFSHKLRGVKWSDEHIRREIERVVREEEGGKTINERQEDTNAHKLAEIVPRVQAIVACSIPMPTGTMKFGGTKSRAVATAAGIKSRARALAKALCTGKWALPMAEKKGGGMTDKPRKKKLPKPATWYRMVLHGVAAALEDNTLVDGVRGSDWMHVGTEEVLKSIEDPKFIKLVVQHIRQASAQKEAARAERRAKKRKIKIKNKELKLKKETYTTQ